MKQYLRHCASCLWCAAALSAVIWTPGIELYCRNAGQFNIGLSFAVLVYAAAMALTILPLAAVMGAFHARHPRGVTALALAASVHALLQFQVWSHWFPDFRGLPLADPTFLLFAVLHLLVLALPFALAWRLRKFLADKTRRIALVILLTQGLVCANALVSFREPSYDFKEFAFDEKGKFTFGQRDNIIVLVVDCMGEGICKEVLDKYPDLRESLHDFTCFDRMVSPLPWTMYAVPAALTGVDFPRKALRVPAEDDHSAYLNRVCAADTSLFTALKRIGFRTEGYPFLLPTISYAPEILDNSVPLSLTFQQESIVVLARLILRRQLPCFASAFLSPDDSLPFLTFENLDQAQGPALFDQTFHQRLETEAKAGPHPAVFKYLHLQGAHETINLDDQLRKTRNAIQYRQLRGSLRNAELLLRRLQELGLYDQATIVIVGDHTECYDVQNIAFVKRKGQRQPALDFNSIPCQISDLAGTILKEYGIPADLPSLFDAPPVHGDGAPRPEQRRRAAFGTWAPADKVPDDNAGFADCRLLLDGNQLQFEGLINQGAIAVGTPVDLYLAENRTGSVWKASLDYTQRFSCLEVPCQGLPDGTYEVHLHFLHPDQEGPRPRHAIGSRLLHLKGGQPSLQ